MVLGLLIEAAGLPVGCALSGSQSPAQRTVLFSLYIANVKQDTDGAPGPFTSLLRSVNRSWILLNVFTQLTASDRKKFKSKSSPFGS